MLIAGELAGSPQLAIEHETIGAHRVGNRFIEIIAIDEHGENAGDAAAPSCPCTST